jgi:uncharacterized protein YkwD
MTVHIRTSFSLLALLCVGCATTSYPPPDKTAVVPRAADLARGLRAAFDISGRLLTAHNAERAVVGVAPLIWDPALAASAAAYGPALAASGGLQHASAEVRAGQGENLWRGTRGAYSLERMVADWASEKSIFRPGIFPNVSTTGNWTEVAHYTQIIWPTTTRVGCAVHQSAQWDYLICRYSPQGNVNGSRVP